jgi:uncharacterized membrane protein
MNTLNSFTQKQKTGSVKFEPRCHSAMSLLVAGGFTEAYSRSACESCGGGGGGGGGGAPVHFYDVK